MISGKKRQKKSSVVKYDKKITHLHLKTILENDNSIPNENNEHYRITARAACSAIFWPEDSRFKKGLMASILISLIGEVVLISIQSANNKHNISSLVAFPFSSKPEASNIVFWVQLQT